VQGRAILAGQLQLRPADRPEALGHPGHVTLEHPHRHRGGVLEQVIGPGEGIGIEREGAAPHGGAAGGVEHAHLRATASAGALLIPPAQILQLGQQPRHPREPLLVDRLAAALRLHALRDAGQRDVPVADVSHDSGHPRRISDVDVLDQLELDVLLQPRDQLGEVLHVPRDARRHQRLDGGDEQVDRRLLRAAEAGAVSTREGQIVGLVEQDRLECADALLQIVDADVLARGGRQVEPEVPLLAQALHRLVGLGHGAQGVVVADRHAFHAALAGRGVHGDREQTASAGLLLLGQRVVRTRQGEAEVAELLAKQVELAAQLHLLGVLEVALRERLVDRLADQLVYRFRLPGLAQQAAQAALHEPHGPGKVFDLVAALAHALHHGVEHLPHLVHQTRDRRVGTHRPAVAAGGAVLRHPLGVVEADLGHVAEQGRAGRNHPEPHEGIGEVVVPHAAGVEGARLLPEAVDVRHGRGAPGQPLDHHGQRRTERERLVRGLLRGHALRLHLADLVEAAPHHAHVVLDHPRALAAELVLELTADRVEQPDLVEAGLLHQRRRGEEGALERDALHAQLQVGVGGLVPFLSITIFWKAVGMSSQTFSGEARSLWMMKTPPSLSPASALVWWKTLGSGESTTST
jgi:hypothetical protein